MPRPPEKNEIQIIVFGPGTGEAILVHFGDGRWFTVDCAEHRSGSPWPLNYLRDVGVDPAAIEMVIVTHWHRDHIQGVSRLYAAATQADLVMSSAGKSAEFLNAMSGGASLVGTRQGSAGYEMQQLAELVEQRASLHERKPLKWVSENTLLLRGKSLSEPTAEIRLTALSPSTADHLEAINYFRQLGGASSAPRQHPHPENPASLVIELSVGGDVLVLGADREIDASAGRGWLSVMDARVLHGFGRASLFKIPHHGSENGFNRQFWEDHLEEGAVGLMTPYISHAHPLPTENMIRTYKGVCSNLFLTSRAENRKKSPAFPAGVKIVASKVIPFGYVVACKAINSSAPWNVSKYGSAREL